MPQIRIFFQILSLFLFFSNFHAEPLPAEEQPPFDHVILISIDGLRADALTVLDANQAPHLHHMMQSGSFTLNARTVVESTRTLPNHTSMFTGRPVSGPNGHQYSINKTQRKNIHEMAGKYIYSIFDVANNNGKTTAFLATKDKFIYTAMSYSADRVSLKFTPKIHGNNVIDFFKISSRNDNSIMDFLESLLSQHKPALTFLHLNGPDNAGHDFGWSMTDGSIYLKEVRRIDSLIGRLFIFIRTNPEYTDRTAIILTSDHGGSGQEHTHPDRPVNFTIPFIVWGKGTSEGADLYQLNASSRRDPGKTQPSYDAKLQPIRNADAGNLALQLLGLNSVPGSTINSRQDLRY